MTVDDGLSLRAMQVNPVGYTVRDALGTVADCEGAHTNELVARVVQ